MQKSAAIKYRTVARAFLTSAQVLAELGDEGDTYGNAIAIVAIHAAISYTDAITVAYGEVKSNSQDHVLAATTLQAVMGSNVPKDIVRLLQSILMNKDTVSYQGDYYPLEDGQALLARVQRYCEWAEGIYKRRP